MRVGVCGNEGGPECVAAHAVRKGNKTEHIASVLVTRWVL